MSIWDFFGDKQKIKEREYLKQLFLVALADGSLDAVERQYIHSIGAQFNIPPDEIDPLSKNLKQEDIQYSTPGNAEEKFFMLFYLVNLIRADGHIHPQEVKVAENMVMRMGYAPDTVRIILQTIENNQNRNISAEDTYQHLKESLGK